MKNHANQWILKLFSLILSYQFETCIYHNDSTSKSSLHFHLEAPCPLEENELELQVAYCNVHNRKCDLQGIHHSSYMGVSVQQRSSVNNLKQMLQSREKYQLIMKNSKLNLKKLVRITNDIVLRKA